MHALDYLCCLFHRLHSFLGILSKRGLSCQGLRLPEVKLLVGSKITVFGFQENYSLPPWLAKNEGILNVENKVLINIYLMIDQNSFDL